MENSKHQLSENAAKKILPFIFVQIIISALGYLYLKSFFNIYCIVSMILTFLLFCAFDYISRHKLIGFFVYAAIGTALFAAIDMIMLFAPNRRDFFEWFLTGAATIETNKEFMLVLILFFTFFISSVVYYFTQITYRVSLLTLIAIIPCAIFVKASQPIPSVYTILLAAADILIYLYHYKTSGSIDLPKFGRSAALTGYVDFAVAALLIALLIPKPQETPYYEQFEEFSSRFSFSGNYGKMNGSYTEHSGNADLYNQMESRQLYIINSEIPEYYKIQVYDSYDSENRWWYSKTASPSRMCRFGWEDEAQNRSLNRLAKAYLEYLDMGGQLLPDSFDRAAAEKLAAEDETVYTAYIRAIDYPSVYLLAPERTVSASIIGRTENSATRKTDLGELMTDTTVANSYIRPNESYTVSFYSRNSAYSNQFIESGFCDMNSEEFGNLLIDMISNYHISNENYDTVFSFLREVNNEIFSLPSDYEGFEEYEISDEMRQLSARITEGLTYDYEKAEAIEAFFNDGSFTYDLSYKAPENKDTPEFFVNESRRGTCSDFATAYCLLAKAAGLNVHYVEGFNQGEILSKGVYNIMTENAHSYPEVYIPGAGWMIYEPTVYGTSSATDDTNGNGEKTTDYLTILITSITIVVLAAFFIVLILLIPTISEFFFTIRVKNSNGSKAVILIYNRLSSRISARFGINTSAFTPKQLSELILEKTETSINESIIDPFEKACYGKLDISIDTTEKALNEYKSLMKDLRKR